MGIMYPEELEKLTYDSIGQAHLARKRLLITDFFTKIMHEFDNDWQKYCDFVESLESSGFIKISGVGARAALEFGPRGLAWRTKLEQVASHGRLLLDMQPGMVIGVKRIPYKHYGIYAGKFEGMHYIIHYADNKVNGGKGKIELILFHEFQNDDPCWIESYNGQIEYTDVVLEQSLARAVSRLNEQKYNLLTNNCEHFATWCVTGISQSPQIAEIVAGLIIEPKQIVQAKIMDCIVTMTTKAFKRNPLATTMIGLLALGTLFLTADYNKGSNTNFPSRLR